MSVGEVISSLIQYASDWDENRDRLLLLRDVYGIQVYRDDNIEINFVDGNTPDVIIDKNGKLIKYLE